MQLLNHMWYLFASEVEEGKFSPCIVWLSMQNCKSHLLWFASSGCWWHCKAPSWCQQDWKLSPPPSPNLSPSDTPSLSVNKNQFWTPEGAVSGLGCPYPCSHLRATGQATGPCWPTESTWVLITQACLGCCMEQAFHSRLDSSHPQFSVSPAIPISQPVIERL